MSNYKLKSNYKDDYIKLFEILLISSSFNDRFLFNLHLRKFITKINLIFSLNQYMLSNTMNKWKNNSYTFKKE